MNTIDFAKFIPPADKIFTEDQIQETRGFLNPKAADVDRVQKAFLLREDVAARLASGQLDQTEARSVCTDWWLHKRHQRPVLLLLGGTGTGKTVAIAETATRTSFATRDSGRLAKAFGGFGTEYQSFEDAAGFEGLLVVDECGLTKQSDREAEMLQALVDQRKWATRPTAILSNLSSDDFKARFDARTVSRLREYGHVVALRGTDMRGAK